MIPFKLPVGGYGDLGGDEGIAQRCEQYWGRRRVATRGLAPEVGVGGCREGEGAHPFGDSIVGNVERREGGAVGRHREMWSWSVCLSGLVAMARAVPSWVFGLLFRVDARALCALYLSLFPSLLAPAMACTVVFVWIAPISGLKILPPEVPNGVGGVWPGLYDVRLKVIRFVAKESCGKDGRVAVAAHVS